MIMHTNDKERVLGLILANRPRLNCEDWAFWLLFHEKLRFEQIRDKLRISDMETKEILLHIPVVKTGSQYFIAERQGQRSYHTIHRKFRQALEYILSIEEALSHRLSLEENCFYLYSTQNEVWSALRENAKIDESGSSARWKHLPQEPTAAHRITTHTEMLCPSCRALIGLSEKGLTCSGCGLFVAMDRQTNAQHRLVQ
jgi:hypothetical protein